MYQDIDVKNAASWEASTPQTQSYATNFNYRLNLLNCPIFSQTITNVQFPGISIGTAPFTTPLLDIPEFGDKLAFEDIIVTYSVLDDLSNYLEIYAWLMYIAGNEEGISDKQREVVKHLKARDVRIQLGGRRGLVAEAERGVYSEATLSLYNRNKLAIGSFNLQYIVPVSISGFDLDVQSQTDDPLKGTATFRFLNMLLTPSTDSQSSC